MSTLITLSSIVLMLLTSLRATSPSISSSSYAAGWNLVAGSSLGGNLDTAYYTLNDAGTDYIAVDKAQLQDFKAYWVYTRESTPRMATFASPTGEPQRELSCRSDRNYPCSPTPTTQKAIPVQQEQWAMIGNSTSEPLRIANISYDVQSMPGVTATFGYIARVYDPTTGSYQRPSPLVVNYMGHAIQVGVVLQPGEGAWIWSPITYVFLESVPTS